MSRLIDADDIPYVTPLRQTIAYKEDIDKMPTIDAVSVVRCKECKHAHMTYGGDCKYCDMWKDDDDFYLELYLDGDFYCSYGERKESE